MKSLPIAIRRGGRLRRGGKHRGQRSFQPSPEPLEGRQLLSFADGNGPVVTGLTEQITPSGTAVVVVSFDGPLNATRAQQASNYAINRFPPSIPEIVTTVGPADSIRAVSYDPGKFQVTLTLARPLAAGVDYRVWINGTPGPGLTDINGVTFDGDNDDTPGGNFYGLISVGRRLSFTDLDGNRALVGVSGGGMVELWRELDGNVDVLTVVGAVPNQTILTGSVRPAKGSDGLVVIPSIQGIAGVSNQLPPSFVSQAPPVTSPTPVVATPQNLPYSLQFKTVSMPSVPAIQSAVFAQAGGKWLLFGGRTNGLHGFDPSGLVNFPPNDQNNNIIVIDPTTGQTWTMPWSATGLPATVTASLSSSAQEFYQSGNRLYTVGGYSSDPITNQFITYDTLSAINVSGLINAVINHGNVAAQVQQIHDPRLRVTGGELDSIGNRSYLVFGQDFEGGYNGSTADYSQIYTDEIRSFRIVDNGNTLAIAGYQAQRDPVNFRRRDYNLGPTILPSGGQGLTGFGGVFTSAGKGYRFPILLNPAGTG